MIQPVVFSSLPKEKKEKILRRSFGQNEEIGESVRSILKHIQTQGDVAVMSYERTFRPGLSTYTITVSKDEISDAYTKISTDAIEALKQMRDHINVVHTSHLNEHISSKISPVEGVSVWREWRAIDDVGLYVPGGKAVYPSSVLMTAIPAHIAGCRRIVMCSPPRSDGTLPPILLVAADLAGVHEIYKVGGAQAIGSLSYGTNTIAPVSKIFGAGNSYVTMAKMLVYPHVAIDMPAGPSEVCILADDTADPRYIAADLLADAEHGDDSACVLITTSEHIAKETAKEIREQIKNLPTRSRIEISLDTYGLIGIVSNIDEGIDVINEYAPEHLEIMTRDPEALVSRIRHAGSVFLGPYTTKSAGDYATGANHVLPTSRMAKMYPPLSVDAFGKWMQIQMCTKSGLSHIRKTVETIATYEELPAHVRSTSIRFVDSTI